MLRIATKQLGMVSLELPNSRNSREAGHGRSVLRTKAAQ